MGGRENAEVPSECLRAKFCKASFPPAFILTVCLLLLPRGQLHALLLSPTWLNLRVRRITHPTENCSEMHPSFAYSCCCEHFLS